MSEPLLKTPCVFGENGNFLLERELGSGGMGGVYMGRDKMLDRPVAVKVMLKEYGSDAEFVEKFKKEAQAAARLIHPNIAQIYSYGISDGMPYIAMELVAGGSLWGIMQANPGKTDVTRVLKICQQVAQALQCSTDQGCVHGDIKPENVLLDANGNAKLVDFGLAGMQKDTKEIWGTPYYIAPEKVRQEVIDFRADMYNLGGTLYHALTNVPPFDGDDVNAVVKARFTGAPKKPSEIRSDLTASVDALVMRMLELDKDKRFPSFEALIEEFKKVLTSGLEAGSGTGEAAKAATTKVAGGKATVRKPAMRRPGTMRRPIKSAANAEAEAPAEAETEEEEKGGNLGLKVFGVVGGVILLIGGIIGGLVWYRAADQKAREERHQREIVAGIAKARSAIADTREKTIKFREDFDDFTAKAMVLCKSTSDELKRHLPDWAAELDPPKPGVTNQPVAVAEGESTKERPAVLDDMQDLWKRAVECQACAERIRQGVSNVLVICDGAERITGTDEKSMEELGAISRQSTELCETLKTSKDVEIAKKANGYIKQKGENAVKQALNRLRIEKLEAERKAKKEREAAEEKARLEAAASAKAAAVEREAAAARAKFDAIVSQGTLRQLDWKGAIRQLEAVKAECKTAEGALAVDVEIDKIEAMQKAYGIFRDNLTGYAFKKSKLKGCSVKKMDDVVIEMVKADGKTAMKVSWKKFYAEYPGNLNELINLYVVKGRENGKRKLNLREWSEAMCGAALTMRIICSDNASAVAYGETLVKQVAEAFPDYTRNLKAMFPDIELTTTEE